ncbi:MAG: valine--tRNA ligase [Planctomycetes bacterium]|nr:valine--tRNA ligase [Planctomycetota bacterium]
MPFEMPTRFDPATREREIYARWKTDGRFTANPASPKTPFTIVIPPPNVTGSLHMGHCLNNTLQDILTRWKRMSGFEALWLPGTDHAGIATQNVVEKELRKEKSSRHAIGREKFLERVWAWKEQYGNTILMQLERMGCSCDWTRTRFTMDAGYSGAIREAFVRLFRKGLIYKGKRIINWCPRCTTALSDIELRDQPDEKGKLWHIRYPVAGGGSLTVATTRPETMLGDTAVAVHPADERYKGLIGKKVLLPLMNREIPIVADAFVDPKFGTGAVKVTPAHDANDYECSQRCGLPAIVVMDERGAMNENAGAFKGIERFEARKQVVQALEAQGLLEKTTDHVVPLSVCDRCDTVIEPYLSDQWFVSMKPLAAPAAEAVRSGRVKFVPERWAKVYLDWVDNVRDWCISRQLWWGHRVPAWKCAKCGGYTSEIADPTKCGKCGAAELKQEDDVLDTWFSSGLWPFATMGWPAETADLRKFYPTSVLATDRGIIYLWVARMIMNGIEFMGKEPFHTVVIHPTIQTDDGKRMSKSLGTGLDPLTLLDAFGADATRFAVAKLVTTSQDMKFGKNISKSKGEEARNFMTKFFNAARFVLMSLDASDRAAAAAGAAALARGENPASLAFEDRWILSRLNTTIRSVSQSLERYEFGEAAQALYAFAWFEYCDWYIELAKPRLARPDGAAARATLLHVLDALTRLLHPIMPFVTEEVWQALRQFDPARAESVMIAPYPKADAARVDLEAEKTAGSLMEIVRAVRDLRMKYNIPPKQALTAVLSSPDAASALALQPHVRLVCGSANLSKLDTGTGLAAPPSSATQIVSGAQLFVPLAGIVDPAKEKARLESALKKTEETAAGVRRKLDDPKFRDNAPPELVEKEKERLAEFEDQAAKLKAGVEEVKGWK